MDVIHKNSRKFLKTTILFKVLIGTTPAFAEDITKSIEDKLAFGNKGAVKIDLNYRYENVNQDNVPNIPAVKQPHTANGKTVRLRAGLLSPQFFGFQGYAEFQGNLALQRDYNNTLSDGKTNFSKIADPERSELNQLWISYTGISHTIIKGGRQRIKLDDDRYIGNVG
jgi:hypothetical protein